jgi:hypothetical protein
VAGDLKLDYAQLEELETLPVSSTGRRIHEVIEHGRRIRAYLNNGIEPVSVPEQIAVVGSGGEVDEIPLDQMPEAELAVRQALSKITAGICAREGVIEGATERLTEAERELLCDRRGRRWHRSGRAVVEEREKVESAVNGGRGVIREAGKAVESSSILAARCNCSALPFDSVNMLSAAFISTGGNRHDCNIGPVFLTFRTLRSVSGSSSRAG